MRNWLAMAVAGGLAVPGVVVRLAGVELEPPVEAALFGVGIIGAAFLLAWAAEVAQLDISQSLALALLALIAVLPEYAIDFVFAWRAGDDITYAQYATANMTGANRLLIGVGWTLVVLLSWAKGKGSVLVLASRHRTELAYLTLATLYSLVIAAKAFLGVGLHLVDLGILVCVFALYIARTTAVESEEPVLVGPAATLGDLPPMRRRSVLTAMALYAAAVILMAAEPFADSLVETGLTLGIDEFILVQWLAPLASEAPEITVALIFVLRGFSGPAMGALMSSKVNQWTLLIGTLPLVYSLSLGRAATLPMDPRQAEELFLTAAQSVFAVTVLANLRISTREALVLLVLFLTQLAFPDERVRLGYGALYLALTVGLLVRRPIQARQLAQVVVAELRATIRRPRAAPS